MVLSGASVKPRTLEKVLREEDASLAKARAALRQRAAARTAARKAALAKVQQVSAAQALVRTRARARHRRCSAV